MREGPIVEPGLEYLDRVIEQLQQLKAQSATIEQVADVIAASLQEGRLLHIFGCGHSQILAEELFYRAGGLVAVNAMLELPLSLQNARISTYFERLEGYARLILDGYQVRPGEVLIIVSTSGRNPVPIEMALAAKERGLKTVALTSTSYSQHVESRHPSGLKLHQICDFLLDNLAEPGDAVIPLPHQEAKVGPTSAVAGIALLWSVIVATACKLTTKGKAPEVWVAANVAGGDEVNAQYLSRFRPLVKHL